MILSEGSGRIRTLELKEEALRNNWTIETNQGGRRTAISRMGHTDSYDGRSQSSKQILYEAIGVA